MTNEPPIHATAEDAEHAFYRAFEAGDLAAMMALWGDGDDLLCVHPMGPALRGRAAIEDSWRAILSGGVDMRFSVEPIQTYHYPDGTLRVVMEHIAVAGGKRVAPMVSTNLYRQTKQGWRMIVHHASPAPDQQHAPGDANTLH